MLQPVLGGGNMAAVPEPANYALPLGGIGLLGALGAQRCGAGAGAG